MTIYYFVAQARHFPSVSSILDMEVCTTWVGGNRAFSTTAVTVYKEEAEQKKV